MSANREETDPGLRIAWEVARGLAEKGDTRCLVDLLRSIHTAKIANSLYDNDVVDLSFLADLIEGHYGRKKGRPANALQMGVKQFHAGELVDQLVKDGLTVEAAVGKAASKLPMSESSVKQAYHNRSKKRTKSTR